LSQTPSPKSLNNYVKGYSGKGGQHARSDELFQQEDGKYKKKLNENLRQENTVTEVINSSNRLIIPGRN
jgi:hypothetical protein